MVTKEKKKVVVSKDKRKNESSVKRKVVARKKTVVKKKVTKKRVTKAVINKDKLWKIDAMKSHNFGRI